MVAMPAPGANLIPLLVPDTHHHLESLAAEVHRTYFFKYPPLPVRWGQQITRKKRRSIRLGSYNHYTTEIRIHPILNARDVPAIFIMSVIHHEYLHHVLGPHHNRPPPPPNPGQPARPGTLHQLGDPPRVPAPRARPPPHPPLPPARARVPLS